MKDYSDIVAFICFTAFFILIGVGAMIEGGL
jgi:hypothetical protein